MFGGATILQSVFQTDGSGMGDRQLELPLGGEDCSDYDIYDEFVDEFGITAVRNAKTICEAAGGYWIEEDDEIACLFSPRPVDCDADFIEESDEFCTDELEATYLCDPSVGYVGCFCNMLPPEPCEDVCDGYDHGEFIESGTGCDGTVINYCCCWNEEEHDGEGEQSACELSYPYCDANCDTDEWCMEIVPQTLFFQQPWCDCVPLYYDSDCNDFCWNNYGYDYGNLAHSHYDCDEYEEYIDGCCCGYYQDQGYCEPCIEYLVGECVCPPGYHEELLMRSTFWCVPDEGGCL